jgi:environmental stress-induced protein Ves
MIISKPCALSSVPSSPWKNGGGSTRTLAVEPSHATFDDFLWRISLAEVSSPGAFSLFPGIDRTIVIWSGNGLTLQASDWQHVLQPLVPFFFKGEDEVVSHLVAGPTTDLNVMVRRGRADVLVEVAHQTVTLTDPAEITIVLCAVGRVQVLAGSQSGSGLQAGEFLRIEDCQPGTILTPSSGDATFLFISLSPLKPASEAETTPSV